MKGFEVARNHESKRDNNSSFVAFTAVLAIIAVLDIIATELIPDTLVGDVGLGILLIVALVAIFFLARPYLE